MQPQTPQPTQPTPPTPPTTPSQPAAPAQPMTPPQPAQPFASAQPVSPVQPTAQPAAPQTPPQTPPKPKSNKLTIILLVVFLVILIGGIAAYFLLANANQSTKTSDSGTVVSPEVVDDETEGGNNNTEDGTQTDDVLSVDTINLDDFYLLGACMVERGGSVDIFSEGLSEKYKYVAAWLNIDYINTMSTDDAESSIVNVSYDEVNAIYQKLFGKDGNVTNYKDFVQCGIPYYLEEAQAYVLPTMCGCGAGIKPSYEEISRQASEDTATIRIKYIEVSTADDTTATTLYDLIFTLEDDHYVLTGLKAVIE